ncbi:MAG: hypothetical protein ACI4QC_05240 [Thermoguttaceae bacterium]
MKKNCPRYRENYNSTWKTRQGRDLKKESAIKRRIKMEPHMNRALKQIKGGGDREPKKKYNEKWVKTLYF